MYNWISEGGKEMSQVYHFLNKPPVKREFFKSCMNKRTKKQNDWHCFNNHSNAFRSVVVTKKHEKTIYTGRLTWNLQINHLGTWSSKPPWLCSLSIFRRVIPMFFWWCSHSQDSRDTPPSEFYQPTATGSTLEALLQESHVNAGVVKKNLEGPKSISPQVHICVGSVFVGPASNHHLFLFTPQKLQNPQKNGKRMLGEAAATFCCHIVGLQTCFLVFFFFLWATSPRMTWVEVAGFRTEKAQKPELRQVVRIIAVSQSCITQLLMHLFETYSNLKWCLSWKYWSYSNNIKL